MPRILGADNVVYLDDRLSDCEIALHYRHPTTEERTAYVNACMVRKGKKTINKTPEARVRFGLKILTGIRDGDFVKRVDGKNVPVSSNPNSDHFDQEWKGRVRESGSDLVELMAAQVFDMPATMVPGDADEESECRNCALAAGFLRENLEAFTAYLEKKHGIDTVEAEMIIDDMEAEEDIEKK